MEDAATVVILIDALGFDLSSTHRFHPECLPNRVRLRSVLGFSQAAITSIMTAMAPDRHEQWMMYSFSSGLSPFSWLRLFSRFVSTDRLWLRRLLSLELKYLYRMRAYYSLYSVPASVLSNLDLPARRDIFRPGAVKGVQTIFDELSGRGVRVFVRDYRTPEKDAFDELVSAIDRREAGFYLLYTSSLDALLHRFGSVGENVASRLRWYEKAIGRVAEAVERSGTKHRIFVLGDHGMCDVTSHLDLVPGIDSLNLRIPGDFIPFYDSSMARFRVHSDRAGEMLGNYLGRHPGGTVLDAGEQVRLGVRFEGGRYGDIIFLVRPGTMILPSFMGRQPVAAMHGYHPDASCMHSILLSNVPVDEDELSICELAPIFLPGFNAGRGGGGE